MTKDDQISLLKQQFDLPRTQLVAIYDAIFGNIGDTLARDPAHRVKCAEFGVFTAAPRAARPGRNPQTGEAITIAAGVKITFKPSLILVERLKRALVKAPRKARGAVANEGAHMR